MELLFHSPFICLHPRFVISSEVVKSFLHVGFLAGWLYWFACFLRYLTLTISLLL